MKHVYTLMRESIGKDPTEKNIIKELLKDKHINRRFRKNSFWFQRVVENVNVLARTCRTTLTNRQLRTAIRNVSIKKCRHCGRY